MLRAIDERLQTLRAELDQLTNAKAKIMGSSAQYVVQPVRPYPDVRGAAPLGSSLRMKILHYLSDHQRPATTDEIAAGIAGSEVLRVRQALYDMDSKSSTVERVGPGTWKITTKGRNSLQEAVTQ